MDGATITRASIHQAHIGAVGAVPLGRSRFVGPSKDAAFVSTLSKIAHDLRGPLANLSILVELMEAYAKVQAYERMAGSARKAQDTIDGLSAMLNGFLERTRETGDPLAFKPGLVDLAEVASQVISLNCPMAERRGITLSCTRHAPFVVQGDKRLLVEALDNLVGNGIKHLPQGSAVTLGFALRGRHAVLSVSDNGPGLAESGLKQALRPYASLRQRKSQSFGLGLWIARLIAERHGGRLDAMARGPDGGACFELSIPARLV